LVGKGNKAIDFSHLFIQKLFTYFDLMGIIDSGCGSSDRLTTGVGFQRDEFAKFPHSRD
jgi:hypothetical protein